MLQTSKHFFSLPQPSTSELCFRTLAAPLRLADLVSTPLPTSVKRTANKAQPKTNRGVFMPPPWSPDFHSKLQVTVLQTRFLNSHLFIIQLNVCVPIPQKCHKWLRQNVLKSRHIRATAPPYPLSSFYPPDSQKLIKNFVPIL